MHNRLGSNIPFNHFMLSKQDQTSVARFPLQGKQLNSFWRETASQVEVGHSTSIKLDFQTSAVAQKICIDTEVDYATLA